MHLRLPREGRVQPQKAGLNFCIFRTRSVKFPSLMCYHVPNLSGTHIADGQPLQVATQTVSELQPSPLADCIFSQQGSAITTKKVHGKTTADMLTQRITSIIINSTLVVQSAMGGSWIPRNQNRRILANPKELPYI